MQIAFLSYKPIVFPSFAIGRLALENLSGVETTASAEFPPSPVLVSNADTAHEAATSFGVTRGSGWADQCVSIVPTNPHAVLRGSIKIGRRASKLSIRSRVRRETNHLMRVRAS